MMISKDWTKIQGQTELEIYNEVMNYGFNEKLILRKRGKKSILKTTLSFVCMPSYSSKKCSFKITFEKNNLSNNEYSFQSFNSTHSHEIHSITEKSLFKEMNLCSIRRHLDKMKSITKKKPTITPVKLLKKLIKKKYLNDDDQTILNLKNNDQIYKKCFANQLQKIKKTIKSEYSQNQSQMSFVESTFDDYTNKCDEKQDSIRVNEMFQNDKKIEKEITGNNYRTIFPFIIY